MVTKNNIALTVGGCLIATASVAFADSTMLPADDSAQFMGVATCASSNCHGATKINAAARVRLNEYFTWSRHDAHRNSFATLRSVASRKINDKLGLGDPVSERVCLSCHLGVTDDAKRGNRFQDSDGIGCESCHGGAERWLGTHTDSGRSTDENLADGMFPTWHAPDRARLCLSCHQGDERRSITHQIMGAGHPRLVFELDTFQAIQPPHHDEDSDYRDRKPVDSGVQRWLVGQVEAARLRLAELSRTQKNGLGVDWAAFDCVACHHSQEQRRWRAGIYPGAKAGELRPDLVSLDMISVMAKHAEPTLVDHMQRAMYDIQSSARRGLPAFRAESLRQSRRLLPLLDEFAHQFSLTEADAAVVLRELLSPPSAKIGSFTFAEHNSMAISVLLQQQLIGQGANQSLPDDVVNAMDDLYRQVAHSGSYQPAGYARALAQCRAALR